MSSNIHYNLRKNNYKETLKLKIMNEISKNATLMDFEYDKELNITRLRNIYKLLNDNIDLFYIHHTMLDSAYNRIRPLSLEIYNFMDINPKWSHKKCKSALLQLNKFRSICRNYWDTIVIALNTKVCPDMVREIMRYIQ